MIYSNEKLRIIPFTRNIHLTPEYQSWFHDQQTCKYNSHGLFPYSAAAMEEFIAVVERGSREKIVWAIEERYERLACPPGSIPGSPPPVVKDWRHIGNVSLQSINWVNRSAELAVVLGRDRGKGLGTQACQWAVEHAFTRLGLNRVWTGTAATNTGMITVCDRLGMAAEGRFRQGMFLDGRFVDVVAFGVTADEYFIRAKETS